MNKFLFALLFAMAAMVSQAWGACRYNDQPYAIYCQFDTGCYEMSEEYSSTDDCTCTPPQANDCQKANKPACTCEDIYANCIKNGAIYSIENVTIIGEANGYGDGINCGSSGTFPSNKSEGGTWVAGLDPDRTVLGCCNWEEEGTKCYTIWSGLDSEGKDGADKVTDCNGGKNKFWAGQCPTTGGTGACPRDTPLYDGPSMSTGEHCKKDNKPLFCEYEASQYNNNQGGCYKIQNEYSDDGAPCGQNPNAAGCESCSVKIAECATNGTLYTDVDDSAFNDDNNHGDDLVCSEIGGTETTAPPLPSSSSGSGSDPSSGSGPPTPSSSSNGGQAPILLSHKVGSNMLVAMQNAINLQSTGNAAVQIYDLKGNAVRALRYSQGSYVVPLSGLPRGLYIVKASSGSWKKTVKVTVK